MDAEAATLAASGATTLVNLMATDGWQKAKELVRRVFGRSSESASAEVARELDIVRTALANRPNGEDIGASFADSLRGIFVKTIDDGSLTVEDLSALVGQLVELAKESSQTASTTINMSANAQGGGKVYQQGYGTQINS